MLFLGLAAAKSTKTIQAKVLSFKSLTAPPAAEGGYARTVIL